jgi:4-alpha-glucanotransferase
MGLEAVPSKENTTRKSGILLHPTSLPSPYGIGDLGDGAYQFVDFLESSNQTIWQVLPIGPTGYGDSPYQAFSSFAGQPLIISPQKLYDMGLLNDEDISDVPEWNQYMIDFGPSIIYKISLLKKAYEHFKVLDNKAITKEFDAFCKAEKAWLEEYSLFMATKDFHNGIVWQEWDAEIAFPTDKSKKAWAKKLADGVAYYKFIQFIFYKQWLAVKDYANSKGIQIVGDIPIFVAMDSADVWGHKELYYLDSKGYPVVVAGVPPDYFSATGQLWGNPLYDWDTHKETDYIWWINRISHQLKLCDVIRIDHFRGFEAYWAIPYGDKTAENGEWRKGPYKELFFAIEKALGDNLPIIAEDLGDITPEVLDLRDTFKLPGMKILQFAFDDVSENDFLPHYYTENSVAYTGTHDNDTTFGWYVKATEKAQDKVRRYMNTDANQVCWDFIRILFSSVSKWTVVPMQDVFSLGDWARMNTPGTASGNWGWRYSSDMLTPDLAAKLADVSDLFGRNQ